MSPSEDSFRCPEKPKKHEVICEEDDGKLVHLFSCLF